MCSEYWSLRIDYDCPLCKTRQPGELQTHWLGGAVFMFQTYEIGTPLPHLRGIQAATLGHDEEDSFISTCSNCGRSIDWAARIEDEAVARVWPYRWTAREGTQPSV